LIDGSPLHCKQHAMNFVCGGCLVLKTLVKGVQLHGLFLICTLNDYFGQMWQFLGCNSSFGNQTTKDVVAMLDDYTINTNENSFVNHHPRWLP